MPQRTGYGHLVILWYVWVSVDFAAAAATAAVAVVAAVVAAAAAAAAAGTRLPAATLPLHMRSFR